MTKIYSITNIANVIGCIVVMILMYSITYENDINVYPYFKFIIPLMCLIVGWVLHENILPDRNEEIK